MKLRIYVAGAFKDGNKINEEWMNPIEEEGYVITHNWTKIIQDERTQRDVMLQRMIANQDRAGVLSADVLVVVMDDQDYIYRGTNTEIGMATAQHIPVLVYDPSYVKQSVVNENNKHESNVFYFLTGIKHFATKEELFQELQVLDSMLKLYFITE